MRATTRCYHSNNRADRKSATTTTAGENCAINQAKEEKELGHSVKEPSGFRVTLQTDTGVSMTEISGLIDMLLKRMMVVVVIVMMVMMMAMIVMVARVMVVVIVVVIREVIVGGWLAIRVPGGR